jgi:hypothetical protein
LKVALDLPSEGASREAGELDLPVLHGEAGASGFVFSLGALARGLILALLE